MIETRINGRWPVMLTEDRFDFHEARPKWEAGRLASCAERFETGMVVYDVGAECGDFTSLYRSWVGPSGTVVPFEPQPRYWPSIRATWEANGFGDPPLAWWPGFAGDTTTLHVFESDLHNAGWPKADWPASSDGPIVPDVGFRHLAQQAEMIPSVRLDAFADISGVRPDIVVMDIEGAEWHALSGATYLMRSHRRPLFYVSVHEATMRDWYGTSLDDIHELCKAHDYGFTELPYNGEAETFWLLEPR